MTKDRGRNDGAGGCPDGHGLTDALLETVSDGICLLDEGMRILRWSPSAVAITGYSEEEATGWRCCDGMLMHVDGKGETLCADRCPVRAALEGRGPEPDEMYLRHRDGHRVPVRVRTRLLEHPGGASAVLEVFSDLSSGPDLRERIERLGRQALLDPLTGLPNRRQLERVLESAMAERERYGLGFGVVMLDLDGLKSLNDSHGHAAGDRALRILGKTLSASARTGDAWGRWGGDEFLGVVKLVDRERLRNVADRMLRLVLSCSVPLDGGGAQPLCASAGAALATAGEEASSVVSEADSMLYRSKRSGGCRLTLG